MFISARNSNNSATLPVSCIFHEKKKHCFRFGSFKHQQQRSACVYFYDFCFHFCSFVVLYAPHSTHEAYSSNEGAAEVKRRIREACNNHWFTVRSTIVFFSSFFTTFVRLCVCLCAFRSFGFANGELC